MKSGFISITFYKTEKQNDTRIYSVCKKGNLYKIIIMFCSPKQITIIILTQVEASIQTLIYKCPKETLYPLFQVYTFCKDQLRL